MPEAVLHAARCVAGGRRIFATEELYSSQGCVISLWLACARMRPAREVQRCLLAHSCLCFCPASWVCPDLAVPYPPIRAWPYRSLGGRGPGRDSPAGQQAPVLSEAEFMSFWCLPSAESVSGKCGLEMFPQLPGCAVSALVRFGPAQRPGGLGSCCWLQRWLLDPSAGCCLLKQHIPNWTTWGAQRLPSLQPFPRVRPGAASPVLLVQLP